MKMTPQPPEATVTAMLSPARPSLEQLLLEKGILTQDQLRIALQEQSKDQQPLSRLLVRLGFLTEAGMRDAMSESRGQQSIDLSGIEVDPAAIRLIPRDVAQRHQLLPLSLDPVSKQLTLVIADPDNIIALDQLRALLRNEYHLITQLAGHADILRAIDRHYGCELPIDAILHEIEPGQLEYRSPHLVVDESSLPLVRLVDALLTEAVQQGASDLHFEPEHSFLRIRYRIDGVLRQVRSLHKSFWPGMVVRLKVISGMNIAETRAPQDGRVSLQISGRQIDFRVASHPTAHGENLVLRILDRHKGIVPIQQLGLDDAALQSLTKMIARPEGIVLVTGPTGSGKTTTLYSILNHINAESVNIMTLEDPVEYPMQMLRQTSVNETIKLDFANGIRSIMRQDPDIILVGEIRDHATAEMAFRAAMTGHQVYSTLHSNSAIGAIPRLLDIGILPEVMAGNINGIIAQRLVRVLCPHCKQPYQPDRTERELLQGEGDADITLFRATGCGRCDHQGYSGRIAIMELLRMDSDLDELLAHCASRRELKHAALARGFRPLAADGLQRVRSGMTSLSEVARVADLTDRVG